MTTPVNHAPMVHVHGPTTLFYGQDAVFTAERSDADDDDLTVAWTAVAGSCPGDVSRAAWPSQAPTVSETFPVPAAALVGGACVWAFVTDSHGATTAAHVDVVPTDRPPEATLVLVAPATPAATYPLYTTFELSADGSTDPEMDPLRTDWVLTRPAGSDAAFMPCPPSAPNAAHRCFRADVPGNYIVSVTAHEDIGSRGKALESSASLTISVAPDAVPCMDGSQIAADGPVHAAPDKDKTLKANPVIDDGDPYPGADGHEADFRWYRSDAAGNTTISPLSFPTFTLPAWRFTLGDTVKVKLEIRDRDQEKMAALFADCKDAPFCKTGLQCFQRVTWTVIYDLPESK